jgi:crossover junction endodeoxyribonuclease RuvC
LIILGIDPGSRHTGFGLIECAGGPPRFLSSGRISAPASVPIPERLRRLADELAALIERERPALAAVEKPFHGVNARSAIVLAEARGALLLTLARAGIAIEEYAPAEVKSAVAGNGHADKQQVARMVRLELALAAQVLSADASDALALALCAAVRRPLAARIAAAGVALARAR